MHIYMCVCICICGKSFTYNVTIFMFLCFCTRLIVCVVLRAVALVSKCLFSSFGYCLCIAPFVSMCFLFLGPGLWLRLSSSLLSFSSMALLLFLLFSSLRPLPLLLPLSFSLVVPKCLPSLLSTTRTRYYRHHPPLPIWLPMGRIGVLGMIPWWYSWSNITGTSATSTTTATTTITTTATTTTTSINTITARSSRGYNHYSQTMAPLIL